MSNALITTKHWKALKDAAQASRGRSIVAVAYFGKGGADMLPLKKGSILVVDASDNALKAGQTHPLDLLKLHRENGVDIYSVPCLHAKIYVLGNKLFIGSANVSSRSAGTLKEVLLCSTDRKPLREAKLYIKSLCDFPLGEEALLAMQAKYRPPKVPGGKNKILSKGNEKKKTDQPAFHLCKLRLKPYPEGSEGAVEKGRIKAIKRIAYPRRYRLEDFRWSGKPAFSKDDIVVQIVDEGGRIMVSPPGRVLNLQKWRNHSFIHLEVPNKKRKNIGEVHRHISATTLKRAGKKRKEIADAFKVLWKL